MDIDQSSKMGKEWFSTNDWSGYDNAKLRSSVRRSYFAISRKSPGVGKLDRPSLMMILVGILKDFDEGT